MELALKTKNGTVRSLANLVRLDQNIYQCHLVIKKSMADSRSTFNVHVKMLVTDVYDFSDIEQDDLLRKGQVMSRAQTVAVPMVSRLASPFNEIVS